MPDRRSRPVPRFVLVLTALFVLLFVSSVQIRYTDSDPRGSLLVATAIIEHGDIKLDAYAAAVADWGRAVRQHDGHIYYFFPLGTAVSSLPFVYVFRQTGLDLTDPVQEASGQIVIVSIVSVLTVWLLYLIARRYVSDWTAWALAVSFWLATPFVSTNATGLWSHDFACLYALVAIHLMLAWQSIRDGLWWRGGLGAVVLAMAVLCRPTMAVFGVLCVVAIVWSNRRLALWMGGTGATIVIAAVLFSLRVFGDIVPIYYLPRRLRIRPWQYRDSFLHALAGTLISPSRGLLVFCPFLLLVAPSLRTLLRQARTHAFVIVLGIVWPLAQSMVVAAFPRWWGGWSFGPRLMTDALPGLFLLLCASLSLVRRPKLVAACAVPLFAVSIWINAWQGCFDPFPGEWNVEPNVDKFPQYVFDWRYPQFLHDARRHEERKRMHQLAYPE